MLRRKSSFLTTIILILLVVVPITNVFAQPLTASGRMSHSQAAVLTREVGFPELGYGKDETYKGVLASRDYSVRWPDAWQVEPGNILKLVFSHSPILHQKSSMVVDWNGTRLSSVLLTSVNIDRAVLEIPIPEELILTGFNRLHVEFYMGIDDDFCNDEDNPGLWATVHAVSSFSLAYSLKAPNLDLGQYPLPLVDNSQLVDNTVTFILPPNPTPSELNAAAIVSAGLGKLATWHGVSIQAQDADAALPQGDLMIIGKPDRMKLLASSDLPQVNKSSGALQDSNGNSVPDDAGMLLEGFSPVDQNAAAVYVTGNSDNAVLLAARALASNSVIPRLSGTTGMVLSVPDPVQAGPGQKQSFTLEELGYPDMQARGTREQNITYIVPLEKTWQNESEVLLDLHFGHSNVLNSRRSSVTVEVNGTAAGSIALNQENATNAHTTFHLPSRLFNVGTNTITISANLRLADDVEKDWDCMTNHDLESWLVVYSDSLITIPGETSGVFITLADYPSAYTGNASLSDVAFVVPDQISPALAAAVMRIAEGLGDAASGDNFYPHVVLHSELDPTNTPYRYLYLIGRPSQNSAFAKFNDSLPLPYQAGTDTPQDVQGVARMVNNSPSAGYIQAFLGTSGVPNIAVAGNTDEGVLWAADVLQNPSTNSKLSGDLALLDGPGSLVSAEIRYKAASRFASTTETEVVAPALSIAGKAVQPVQWIVYAAAAVFALSILILIIFIIVELQHRQKARAHHGSHTA